MAVVAVPCELFAQGALVVNVRDSLTMRPLVGAAVSLVGSRERLNGRTDDNAGVVFRAVQIGSYRIEVRQIGYEPRSIPTEIRSRTDTAVLIAMSPIRAYLDTVYIRASRQGVFGVVATRHDLEPLSGAKVEVFGQSSAAVATDSAGRFFIQVKSAGPYLVRAARAGLVGDVISVTVPRNQGVEVAFLLDSTSGTSNRIEHAYAELRERMTRRGMASALVTASEITNSGYENLLTALNLSPSVTRKAMRFSRSVCVYVDGRPRPGLSLASISANDVYAVEVYGPRGEASGTLAAGWPRRAPCTDTGLPLTRRPGNDLVQWLSIWLKP